MQTSKDENAGLSNSPIGILVPSIKRFFDKLFVLACILLTLGLPVQAPLVFFFLLIACLALVTSDFKINGLRFLCILGSLAFVVLLKLVLPGANIEEGNNLFLVKDGNDKIFSTSLPPQVYQLLSRQFKDQYPPERWCSAGEDTCWRSAKLPTELFAFSTDSVFRNPKYSRVVDSIDFDSLQAFRGGFVNSLSYNWGDKHSDVKRENMPYFVMYELSRESVGSDLCWKGHIFWETIPEQFEYLPKNSTFCRSIEDQDVGKKIYGIAVLKDEPLAMSLKLSSRLKISATLKLFLSIAGTLVILALGTRPKLKSFVAPATIMALTLIVIPSEMFHSFAEYIVQEGTNDGILHESYGRDIFRHVLHGEIGEALRGEESVYYFMPGLRYFFALEKFIFGDTGFGKLCILLLMPISYYYLLRVFFPVVPSSLLMFLFLFVTSSHHVHNGLTLRAYMNIAARGEAEVLGYSLLVFGLALMLKNYHQSYNNFCASGIFANVLIAFSIFVRPNLVLPAFLFFLFIAWSLYRSNRVKEFFIISTGFLPFFLIPLHNFYFGETWALLTSRSSVSASYHVGVTLSDYIEAFRIYVLGDPSGGHLHKIKTHLGEWVENRWWRVYLFALSLFPLLPFRKDSLQVKSIALVCFGSHLMLFFFQPGGRYALLAWLLSAVIVLVLATKTMQALMGYVKKRTMTNL